MRDLGDASYLFIYLKASVVECSREIEKGLKGKGLKFYLKAPFNSG